MNEKLGAWQVGGGAKSGKARFIAADAAQYQIHSGLRHVSKGFGSSPRLGPSLAPAMTQSPNPEGEIREWQTRFNPVGVDIDTARQLLAYRRYCTDSQNRLACGDPAEFFRQRPKLELTFPENGQWLDLPGEPQWTITVTNRRYGLGVGSNWGHIFYKT